MAACRMGSSRSTLKLRPLGWTVTLKDMGEGRRGARLDSTADFARTPVLHDRPARFKRPVLLIVGCGDIGVRVARLVRDRWRVLALTSSIERIDALRAVGAVPLHGNVDQPQTLGRLADLADAVLHLAPSAAAGIRDSRTRHLVRAL